MVCDSGGSSRPPILLSLILTVLGVEAVGGQYVVNHCYCFSDGFDANITAAIAKFPPQNSLIYQYTGALYNKYSSFVPCQCADVTRVQTTVVMTNTSIMAAANATIVPSNASAAAVRNATQTTTLLLINLSTKMMTVQLPQMRQLVPSLNSTLISGQYYNLTNVTATAANFNLQFVLRGRNASLSDQVCAGLVAVFSNDTSVNLTSSNCTVVGCNQTSPAPPTNGNLTSTGTLAGATATYTCNAGYRLSTLTNEVVSVCDHNTTTWTPLPANLSCPLDMRCKGSPPPIPQFMVNNWDRVTREQGTQITYTCQISYRPVVGTSMISTCQNTTWTNISTNFQCEYVGCSDSPPQVPDNVKLYWDSSMLEKSTAIYSCVDGFVAIGSVQQLTLTCLNMTWGELPSNFLCVGSDYNFMNSGNFDDVNYFFIVTIPSLAALMCFMCCCLCCTRIDSPLFCLCSPRKKSNSYP
ncbi:CUB and sushi domain-containing protein 1 isoform X2 [Cherax quadricarinatus]|uniref:CUB and sushi domain-containing protein 1 isoform X2 n=1 Tax=Cherax quadricarinatus TaxID=27406 RepID=UPI00237985DA|nr:uncharacterized protein LOC128696640 isoform X2 [Cherax quadricarinatus]